MGMCPFFHVPVLDYHLRITDDGASSVDPKYHEYYLQFSVLYKSYWKVAQFICWAWMETESWNARYDQPVLCKSTGISYYRYSSADAGYAQKCFSRYFWYPDLYEEFSDRCHCSFVCTCRQREICCQKQNDGICYIAS